MHSLALALRHTPFPFYRQGSIFPPKLRPLGTLCMQSAQLLQPHPHFLSLLASCAGECYTSFSQSLPAFIRSCVWWNFASYPALIDSLFSVSFSCIKRTRTRFFFSFMCGLLLLFPDFACVPRPRLVQFPPFILFHSLPSPLAQARTDVLFLPRLLACFEDRKKCSLSSRT